MSHQSVRFLLRDVSNSLADNIEFRGGRETEFNNLKSKATRYRWLLPMTGNISFANQTRTTTWSIALLFMQQDTFDASAEETNKIHDETDLAIGQFLQRLDDWSLTQTDTVGDIQITGITKTPFYKDQAGIYSGWLVRFQLITPDDFIYCTPDNIEIYAGTYRNS
jgi:hypothetical protein